MVDEIIRSVRNETRGDIRLYVGDVVLPAGKIIDLFKVVSDDYLLLLQLELSRLEKRKAITVIKRESRDTLTLANDRQARKDISGLQIEGHDDHNSISGNRIIIDSHSTSLLSIQSNIGELTSQVSDLNFLVDTNKTDLNTNTASLVLVQTDIGNLELSKALKVTSISTVDLTPSIQADSNTQSASYVQADVQSIADLANDLKVKVNIANTLINELKAKINEMNT